MKEELPLVSIVTPSYNKGPFIEETILSIRNQTYLNVEHIVMDAGACWGDTALHFADMTGAQGKVYSFELGEDNLHILPPNISLNQSLADRIGVVPRASWHKSGEPLSFRADGPVTSLERKTESTQQVSTLSLDDFVKQEGIARVDYIKMDIEGSELRDLKGAEETMRTFRPRLAISVYHKEDDLISIPIYLDSLGLQYEFFLDHFAIHREETVLFATPSMRESVG